MMEVTPAMFKKLHKEHLLLQRSFTALCQTLNGSASQSQRPFSIEQQKEMFHEEVNGLNRQIELLTLELQETRDQNELLEFRIHELEQCNVSKSSTKTLNVKNIAVNTEKVLLNFDHSIGSHQTQVACTKCYELEIQLQTLQVISDQNQKFNQRHDAAEFRAQQGLFHDEKYSNIKEGIHELSDQIDANLNQTKEQNNNNNKNETTNDNEQIDILDNRSEINGRVSTDSNQTKVSECSNNNNGYGIGYAMTSEDEGLGDDTRRDNSSGPSSLHESEYDVISVQSTSDTCMVDAPVVVNQKSTPTNVNVNLIQSNGEKEQVSLQNHSILLVSTSAHSNLLYCQGYIEQLEKNLEQLKEEKANLEEQVLELEEAENDARLISQRLERQVETLLDQYDTMRIELIDSKKTIEFNKNKINSLEKIELELRDQIIEITNELYRNFTTSKTTTTNDIGSPSSITKDDDINKMKKDYKHKDLLDRITCLEKEDRNLQDQLFQVDDLNTELWEKLYKLESQIDAYKENYEGVKEVSAHDNHLNDDDLQLFVSADQIAQTAENHNVGSWFDAAKYDHNNYDNKHCNASDRLDDLVLSMPLCETVRPERIDIKMNSPTRNVITQSNLHVNLPEEIYQRINKLENNEQQLKDKLLQLEWINKEFVKELELREKLFIEKQQQHHQWCKQQDELINAIEKLQCERKQLSGKVSELEIEKNHLVQQINAHRSALEEIKKEHEREIKQAKKEQENVVQSANQRIDQLKGSEIEYLEKISSLENQQLNENHDMLIQLKANYSILKNELNHEKENVIKLKKDFANELNNLISYHISYENELKEQINDLEIKDLSYGQKIELLLQQETSLKQILVNKENELIKLQQTHVDKIKKLEEEHQTIEKELKMKMQTMEEKTTMTVKELEFERNQIQKELESTMTSYKEKEKFYIEQINLLKQNVNKLEDKVIQIKNEKIDEMKLRNEISQLKANEVILQEKLSEMKQKESAYEETLAKADKIIFTLEREYKERIEELEKSEKNLKSRISQMEEGEAKWKRLKRRPGQISDLVQQLIDSDTRECALREQIAKLESSEKQLIKKIQQLTINLESELRDHDELVSTVGHLQQQVEMLKKDLSQSLQLQDSLREAIKDTEKYCQQREQEINKKYQEIFHHKKSLLEIEKQIQHPHQQRHFDFHENSPQETSSLSYESETSSLSYESNSKVNFSHREFDEPCDEMNNTNLNHKKDSETIVQMDFSQKNEDKSIKNHNEKAEQPYSSLRSISPCSSSDSDKCDINKFNEDSEDLIEQLPQTKPFPPNNLRIVRKVGCDALLVGWQVNKKNNVSGYEIMVNNIVLQRVRNSDATKALLHKLDLSKSLLISITSISYDDIKSDPIETWYHSNNN